MSNLEHFRSRAAEYRRLAQDSRDERRAGDLFEIANLFDSMAAHPTFLTKHALFPPQSRILGISAIFAGARTSIWQSGKSFAHGLASAHSRRTKLPNNSFGLVRATPAEPRIKF